MILLPDLPYAYDALEPVLSQRTLRLHHDKHHAKYVAVVNDLVSGTDLSRSSLEALIGESARSNDQKLADNAGQAWNHGFFWASMSPKGQGPSDALGERLREEFRSLEGLRDTFVAAGAGHFGSGWVWLARGDQGLEVLCTHDGGSLATSDAAPLLVCDLWEHAYYLDHQNDRAGFLAAWFDRLANWSFAETQLLAAETGGRRWTYPQESKETSPGQGDLADQLTSTLGWSGSRAAARARGPGKTSTGRRTSSDDRRANFAGRRPSGGPGVAGAGVVRSPPA
jgi:Fe-Mn family superoxide dismutase